MTESDWLAEGFEKNRTRLRTVAYRTLGSLAEANDAVQGHNRFPAGVSVLKPRETLENGGTTMLKKVVYVALLVSDQDKALDFYTNVIGLQKRGDYPTPDGGARFLSVGVEGQDFELVLWPGTPARAKEGSAVYTIEVEDCREAFETLKSRGVNFEPPEILEFSWGYAARFRDPDGNLLQVREGSGTFRR